MKHEFIETANTRKFMEISRELQDPASMIGPSLAMVTGPAGRGKTEAAKRFATLTEAVYIPPMNIRTENMMLRDITFELSGERPYRRERCLSVIGEEMKKARRLVIIDEADLLETRILQMLRNVNEQYACPILFIGEDGLKGRIASQGRFSSRIRRRMEFGPVGQQDIAYFFKQCLVPAPPEVTALIHHHSRGDWRPVVTIALAIERAMKASGTREITLEMVQHVLKA
ncbi:MAG TPA: AAA family ATPase [Methanothrix sp.]|nr:AAA family ATPase [Methanothrix sp.]